MKMGAVGPGPVLPIRGNQGIFTEGKEKWQEMFSCTKDIYLEVET